MGGNTASEVASATKAPLFTEKEWAEISSALQFSPQQSRIAALLLDGLGDKQIAHYLGIAVPTLRTHISRIFVRLAVSDRAELTRRVFQEFRYGCHHGKCHRMR